MGCVDWKPRAEQDQLQGDLNSKVSSSVEWPLAKDLVMGLIQAYPHLRELVKVE